MGEDPAAVTVEEIMAESFAVEDETGSQEMVEIVGKMQEIHTGHLVQVAFQSIEIGLLIIILFAIPWGNR